MSKKQKKQKAPDIWPGMTAKQHEALAHYIRSTADAVGLQEWRFTLRDKPADEGNLAEIDCTFGRQHASIRVCEDWFKQTIEERRHAIMHELTHALTDRVEQPLRDELYALTGVQSANLLINTVHTNMEYAVDEISRILVKFSDDDNIVHYLEGRMKP